MRDFKRFIMMLAAIAAVSCASDSGVQSPDAQQAGTLDMTSLVAVISEGTRSVIVDDLAVRLIDSAGQLAAEWTVASRPAQATLLIGNYTLQVCTPTLHAAAWESPWYNAEQALTIVPAGTTSVDDMVCRLGNVKATVHYSSELRQVLTEADVVITVGEGTLSYAYAESRAGYFAVPTTGRGIMRVEFTGMIDGYEETLTHVIEVEAGSWQRVFLTFGEEGGLGGLLITVYDSSAGQIGNGNDWGEF